MPYSHSIVLVHSFITSLKSLWTCNHEKLVHIFTVFVAVEQLNIERDFEAQTLEIKIQNFSWHTWKHLQYQNDFFDGS